MNNNNFLAPYKISYLLLIIFAFFASWQLGGGREGFREGFHQSDEEIMTKSKIVFLGRNLTSKSQGMTLSNGDSLIKRTYPYKIYIYDKYLKSQSTLYEFIETVLSFTIIYQGIFILVTLYKFIHAVAKSQVFTLKNINRLTKCGWYCLALTLTFYIHDIVEYLEAKKMLGAPLIGSIKVDFMFWPALLGLVLLTLGYAFRKGWELQQENELTV